MNDLHLTTVIRHRRENLKKCSLKGLERRTDFVFYTYPFSQIPLLRNHFLLSFEGPLLSLKDADFSLLVLDGTWRYAKQMEKALNLPADFPKRSLPPGLQTAYPRRQEDCLNPERGLASIEAIYAAYVILGRPIEGLLDHYYWREEFLKKNAAFL